ncbi:hypothetical protein [Nocardia sp. alder85J]|uniref:hypothetical protein n=1 Tax=Nocardia sp. alder85J TaxID=2862949 RepID=UPI001CD7FE8F|nr:hypothetical protein [Nocardia sp. alder85J]MCX4092766.1 hypothetical protein [Nocardia sp. alder85J]
MFNPTHRIARAARFALAAAGVAVALTAGGTSAAADTPAPAPEELQATLDKFVDPGISTADKEKLVVSGDQRAANIDTMTGKLAGYGHIGFVVTNVQATGDDAAASVAIASPHGTIPGFQMSWQHSDAAGWQLTDGSACTILALGRAAC